MSVVLDDPAGITGLDAADWLMERRRLLDGGEAAWLAVLADFDLAQGWRRDGQLSAVEWLQWRLKMARSTAFEKLKVAHELRRRPRLMAAFAAGEISYCAVRLLCRAEDPSPEVEESLMQIARDGTVRQLQRAIEWYRWHRDQDRPPDDDGWDRRRLSVSYGFGNLPGRLEATLSNLELDELKATLEAFRSRGPVEEYARADSPGPRASYAVRQADALMDILRVGLAHAHDGHAMGADRYLVHLVATPEEAAAGTGGRHLDGRLLDHGVLGRIRCDCSLVAQVTADGGEPLNIGRKQHDWTTAQRRAILVRDGSVCRFPGCDRRRNDIHHIRWWEHGGLTDVANGCLECDQHHTLIHRGWTVEGDANGELRFYRPDGTYLDSSFPHAATYALPWPSSPTENRSRPSSPLSTTGR